MYFSSNINVAIVRTLGILVYFLLLILKSSSLLFISLFYLSQFLFDKNQKEKADVYLNKALEIEKDSEFIKNYIKINNDGYSFFTYNKNKSKLEGYYSE